MSPRRQKSIATNRPRLAMVALVFVLSATAGEAQEPRPKKKQTPKLPKGVELVADIEYAQTSDGPLKLDVFRPSEVRGDLPVIVFVHGGGWRNGSKDSARRIAVWLVPEGYAVVSIEYRLTDVARWPAQINDCYSAVRWVRDHAKQYHFDGDRIAAWGTSAGGHLVALMGTRPFDGAEKTDSRVQAVIDWFGPTDLLTMPPNMVSEKRTEEQVANSNGAKLLGATVKSVPDLAHDASAMHHVSADDPPTLIMHGENDTGVPMDQSRRFAERLIEAGVPAQLSIVQGAGHGGKEFQSDEVRGTVREFLKLHL